MGCDSNRDIAVKHKFEILNPKYETNSNFLMTEALFYLKY